MKNRLDSRKCNYQNDEMRISSYSFQRFVPVSEPSMIKIKNFYWRAFTFNHIYIKMIIFITLRPILKFGKHQAVCAKEEKMFKKLKTFEKYLLKDCKGTKI